jgi:hypothetical protein
MEELLAVAGVIVGFMGALGIERWKLRREHRRYMRALRAEVARIHKVLSVHDTFPEDRYNNEPRIAFTQIHRIIEGVIIHGADESEDIIPLFLELDGHLRTLELNARPVHARWKRWHDAMMMREMGGVRRAAAEAAGTPLRVDAEMDAEQDRSIAQAEGQMARNLADLDAIHARAMASLAALERELGMSAPDTPQIPAGAVPVRSASMRTRITADAERHSLDH